MARTVAKAVDAKSAGLASEPEFGLGAVQQFRTNLLQSAISVLGLHSAAKVVARYT